MNAGSHQLINQTSGGVEYFTPPEIIAAARRMLGWIELDPASCPAANVTVRAGRFFTREDDGLAQPWHGRVWMNHPFHAGWKACGPKCRRKSCRKRGRKAGSRSSLHITRDIPSNADWINKLEAEFCEGRVSEALCITFAATSERWFQPLLARPQCFLYPRTNYYAPDGTLKKGITKGSVVTYYGLRERRFAKVFGALGWVKVASRSCKR